MGSKNLDLKASEYIDKDAEDAAADPAAPATWFFATTFFPLVGASFGPVASAFSICALITHWRTHVNPNSTEAEGSYIADPAWVLAINAVSLFFAITANFALIAHMAGRITFHMAHPTVTIGWYIASILLIGIIAAIPEHSDVGEFTFTQAYYYACLAAGLYFILASMLVCTAWGVYVRGYSREYKLTWTQRTLMMQTVAFLIYLLAAAGLYSRIENWNFLDAVYWADVTLFTIGFGDFKPQTHLGRSLFFPMAVGGIIFVGIIVASVKSLMVDDGIRKVSRRNVEKVRRRFLAEKKEMDISAVRDGDPSTELERREREFELMRRVQAKARFINASIALSVSVGVVLILWFIGAVVFWKAESLSIGGQDWTYFEALYFTYVSFLTVGYGDFYPQTNSAKPAFVLWSLLALPALTVLVGALADVVVVGFQALTLIIANHLPARTKSLRKLKDAAAKVKKSEGGSHTDVKPPGFMSPRASGPEETTTKDSETASPEPKKDVDFDDPFFAAAVRGIIANDAHGEHYRPYLLLKALRQVIGHVGATPPRTYNFAEWAWFMKLLGSDEADPQTHDMTPMASNKEKSTGADAKAAKLRPRLQPFSWLGTTSPLMSTEDEPKWILEKLVDALENELRAVGDEKAIALKIGQENSTENDTHGKNVAFEPLDE